MISKLSFVLPKVSWEINLFKSMLKKKRGKKGRQMQGKRNMNRKRRGYGRRRIGKIKNYIELLR